jgi:DNA-binding transcriptional MerR regulator/quercetin dioxygenase-like cupin family protein
MLAEMPIHAAAQAMGVNPSTLRLWERSGLLTPQRTPSGHRRYTPQDLSRIGDIRRLRVVQGLNLAAIRSILGVNGAAPRRVGQTAGDQELGRHLHATRVRCRLTLRQVSRRTGLAISFVNSIEHGIGRPSIASLTKLARCYGTTISTLTSQRVRPEGKVIRAGRYRTLPILGKGIKVEQLAEGQWAMECQRFTIRPGAGSEGPYAHKGEEFIHVLTGEFEISLDGRELYRLGPGDSTYFKSTSHHAWRNPGSETAVLLWINTPPTF